MTKDELIIAQQARIEQLVTLLREAREWNWLDDDAVKIPCKEEVQDAISTKDDLSALREHDEKLLAPYQWQPIETAPKDGTEVLLYLGEPYSHIEKARWFAPWDNWQTGDLPDDPDGEEYHGIGSKCPTHWMPIHSAEAIEKGGV